MATRQVNLDAAIDSVAVQIAAVTSSPKPNYSLDGESYSWADYLSVLTDKMEKLLELRQLVDAPFEVDGRLGL